MRGAEIVNRISLEGGQTVIAQLGEMGATGRAAMASLQTGAAGLNSGLARVSEGAAKIGMLGAVLRPVVTLFDEFARGQRGQMASTLGSTVERMGEGLPGLALGLAALGGAFFALSMKAAEATHTLEDQAAALGMDVNQFQALRLVAGEAGVAQERLVGFLERFSAATGQAQARTQEFGIAQRHAADEAANARTEMSIATDQARLADERFADAQRQSVFSIRSADNASLNAARSLERLQEQYRTAPTDDLRVRLNEAADASAQADERAKEARRRRDEADEEHDVQSALRNQRLEEQRQQAEDAAAAKRNQVQEQADAMLNRAAGMGADKTTQLAAFADMWKELGSQEEKAAIGQAAFGRGWVEMAPLLQQGGQALIAAMAVAKQYTIPLLEPEKKMAAAFVEGFARMKSIIEANVRVIGDTLGQMFVPAMNRIADFFKNNHDAITAWATAAVRNVVDFGHAIGEFLLPPLQLVSEVVQTVGSFLSGIASGLNSIFGGNLSGGSILGFVVGLRLLAVTLRVAATAAAALRVALLAFDFGGVMAVIGALGAGFGALAGWIRGATVAMFAFDAAGALPLGALALIVAALASLGIGIYLAITHWDQLKANLQAFAGWLLGGFLKAWDYIASYISGVFKDAVKWVEDFINKVEAAIKKVGSLLSASSGAPGGDLGGAATPFARGGHVGGHGHGDTVPAMLTPGEFVVRQPAVAHYGAQVFHAINNMRANIQGFSLGGMVGGFNDWSASLAPGPVLSFAAGGIVPAISGGGGGRTINIHINGETIGPLHTSDDRVVEAAERASSRSQIRSAGRMPSWFTPVG